MPIEASRNSPRNGASVSPAKAGGQEKTMKPSFAAVAATASTSPTSITATIPASKPSPTSTGAPHSITTEHVDKKTGEAYKITKYRDNTSVAGGFTKLGVGGGGNSDGPKRNNGNRNNNYYNPASQQQQQQQRTPSPPSIGAGKPSNLAARRAATQQMGTIDLASGTASGPMRKPLAPIAINAYPGLLRSEFSPASFGSLPPSAGLSPSPTSLNSGRRSPYGAVPAPVPSPTHVSPHIANAYYEQSAKKGSATYNEDGELEYEDEEPVENDGLGAYGLPSPMLMPNVVASDPNVETLLAYQAMLAQPPQHSGSNTASLASAYIKYLEAQANLNHFVNSTLEQTGVSTASASSNSLATSTGLPVPPPTNHLSPEVMAALAQQEQVAASTLKRRAAVPMAYSASSPVHSSTNTSSSADSLFGNIHQTPASFRLARNGGGTARAGAIGSHASPTAALPLGSAPGLPISPSPTTTWGSSRASAYGGIPATPFSPFDGHPSRYLLSSGSTPYTATPSAVSATSSAYSSPLPSPASSTSSLPESDLMRRTESMQSTDSYTTYASSSVTHHSAAAVDAEEKERFAKMAKYGYGMGAGASAGAGAAAWGSEADWSTNWRRRGPLDYVEPSAPLLSSRSQSQQHQPLSPARISGAGALDLDLGMHKLGLGHPLDMAMSMPGAPISKPIGLPAVYGDAGSAMRSPFTSRAAGGGIKGSRAFAAAAAAAAAVAPPTPTLLDQEFVDGLMRTGYSEDEFGAGAEQQHQQQHQHQQQLAPGAALGKTSALRTSPSLSSPASTSASSSPNPGLLGLAGLRKLNPMAQLDMETPLARDVARF
ncbi:hypothetical protein OC834_001950 [Tilletia horrida]|nr:hypothetical protein OC834_001950 [Tilletia horrida]